MAAQFSDEALRRVFGAHITAFASFEAPDVCAEFRQARYWMANYGLNSIFEEFDAPYRHYIANFVFRAHMAFSEYEAARTGTQSYVNQVASLPGRAFVKSYLEAIGAWEAMLLNLQAAFEVWNRMGLGDKAYEKGDGSPHQRLADMANRLKHAGSDIEYQAYQHDAVLPIWCENDGLHTHRTSVTYDEIAEVLREVGKVADDLQDPRTLIAALKSLALKAESNVIG